MKPYLTLGPVPADEPCAQTIQPDYAILAQAECQRYLKLVRESLGTEPEGAKLRVRGFQHDYGTYYEVVCEWETGNEKAEDYAYMCEAEAPMTWEG